MVTDKYGHECDQRCYYLLEAIPEAVHVIDSEYKVVFVNSALKKRFRELGLDVVIGKSLFENVPFLSQVVKDEYASVFKTGKSINTSKVYKFDNSEMTVDVTKVPNMCTHNHTVVCVITIVRDTTPLTESIKYLRLNEERLESLLKLWQFKTSSEEDVISFALEEGVRLTFSDVGFFHFVEGADESASLKLIKWSKKVYDDCSVAQNQHYPLDKAGNWVDCIRERRPIIYNDYQNSPNRKGYPEGHFPIKRFMSVPVFDGDNIVAVVGVGNKQTDYDETDLRQLHLFMNSTWEMIKSKRAEEAHTISELRYRRLFETAKDGILLVDAKTAQITDVNPFIVELLGYTYEDLLGKKLWEIGLFKNTILSKVAFEELQVKTYIRYEDLPLETKDGRSIEVEFVSNVYAVNGLKVIQCNIRDITARKVAEHALKREHDKLQQYLDVAAGIVVALDTEGNIELLNKRGCDILGCLSEEAVFGKNWFDLFVPERVREEVRQIHKHLITDISLEKRDVSEYENPILTSYGEERIVKWRNIVFRDDKGVPYNTLSYGTDVTEQRDLEKERADHWDKLEEELKANLKKLKTNGHTNGYHTTLSKAKEELDKAMSDLSIDLNASNPNLKVVK